MKILKLSFLSILMLFSLGGCVSLQTVNEVSMSWQKADCLAQANTASESPCNSPIEKDNRIDAAKFFALDAVKTRYLEEWRFNRSGPDAKNHPPALCLALSGGGMRSAAFSIGVMSGLHEKSCQDGNFLDKVDVISSVSGGSYASSWYFIQNYFMDQDETNKNIFHNDHDHQQHLIHHGNTFVAEGFDPGDLPPFVLKGATWVASWIPHWTFNILFDWRANLNPLHWFYRNGLEREFHLKPVDQKRYQEANGCSVKTFENGWLVPVPWCPPAYTAGVDAYQRITFEQLGEFVRKKELPYFIFNATADVQENESGQTEDRSLRNRVYEFTPLWQGSDYYGYWKQYPFDVHEAVVASGAAFDTANLPEQSGWGKLLAGSFNTNLGVNFPNPNMTNKRRRVIQKILPFPFYQMTGNSALNREGTHIYLADGGQVENLGLFSLLRRRCAQIITVDAEYDLVDGKMYQFGAMALLQEKLAAQYKNAILELVQPDTRQGLLDEIAKTPSGHPETVTPYVTRWIFKVDFGNRIEEISKITNIKMYLAAKDMYNEKLSYDARHYAKKHKESICTGSVFPHQSTSDQLYSPSQFKAYRDLGKFIVENYFKN
ncbi:MAG: patatin-like phospholipase family protein [Magnetococcales bacterium]|nr:patatin-like phospholipase family protein [Magnetococcales bacterium]